VELLFHSFLTSAVEGGGVVKLMPQSVYTEEKRREEKRREEKRREENSPPPTTH
jgi:hypothetical protein